MKISHLLLLTFIIVSCGSQRNSSDNIKIYKSEISALSTSNLSYVEPIIDMSVEEAKTSRTKFYFLKYTKKSLDSILSKEVGIFNFKQRVSIADNDELLKSINLKLDSLVNQVNKNQSIEGLVMPKEFASLKAQNIETILLIYIQPKFSKKGGSYSSGSKRSKNYSVSIESPGHRLDSAKTNLLVFDVLTEKLVLYSNTQKLGSSYNQNLITHIKSIISELEDN